MRIAQAQIDEIVAHSRDDMPNECCGLMGGRDGEVRSVHRGENEYATHLRFKIKNPVPLIRAIEDDAGDQVVGIYHSHTRSEAYPSQTDINLAGEMAKLWMNPVWFICSLQNADEPVVRAFSINEGQVEEVDLQVSG